MAKPSLELFEVALIKTMIERGYANKTIQFYFNKPDRAVNSGRISEIKGGDRWADVEPASQFELDEFIDHHPLREQLGAKEEPEPPRQVVSASVFTVTDDDLVEVLHDPVEAAGEIAESLDELYEELREKSSGVLALGHNLLGEASQPVEQFDALIQRERAEVSAVMLWSKGNRLRATLNAHDAVAHQEDMHPSKLDGGCVEQLRDLIYAFNILVASDPRIAELDRLSLGPEDRKRAEQALDEFRDVLANAGEISTPKALETINEQIEASDTAPQTADGDRDVALAQGTTQNYAQTIILGAYRRLRSLIGEEISSAWSDFKTGVVRTVAGAAGLTLVTFVAQHAPALQAFIAAVKANPAVQAILDFVLSMI